MTALIELLLSSQNVLRQIFDPGGGIFKKEFTEQYSPLTKTV
jgi:hypothetical protein